MRVIFVLQARFNSLMRPIPLTAGGLVGLLLCLSQMAAGQSITGRPLSCTDGQAGGFPCSNIDLLSYLHYSDLGGTPLSTDIVSDVALSDIWGWTDPETGKEYALVARTDGAAFVDISDPVNPLYLGQLLDHAQGGTMWRDLKVYADHVFIVADGAGAHGMQVFDLTQLRNVENPPVTFTETAHYDGFDNAHNIVINEATGFAYAVGSAETCGGGLHMIDIRSPAAPAFVGCFADTQTGRASTGYTHDAQCVIYQGPDTDYLGHEICLASNETAVSILDVTNKENPSVISRAQHPDFAYVHQGWLTEDHRYFLLGDEVDERRAVRNNPDAKTRTFIWDLADLDNPTLLTLYEGVSTSIDHNQYIAGQYAFQANYTSGLRIVDISTIADPVEVGFFDTFLRNDAVSDPEAGFVLWRGAWSTYPFFESGTLIVSSVGEGLFMLKPTGLVQTTLEPTGLHDAFALAPPYPNPFGRSTTVTITVDQPQHVRVMVYNMLGQPVQLLHDGVLAHGHTHRFTLKAHALPAGVYLIHATAEATTAARRVVLTR